MLQRWESARYNDATRRFSVTFIYPSNYFRNFLWKICISVYVNSYLFNSFSLLFLLPLAWENYNVNLETPDCKNTLIWMLPSEAYPELSHFPPVEKFSRRWRRKFDENEKGNSTFPHVSEASKVQAYFFRWVTISWPCMDPTTKLSLCMAHAACHTKVASRDWFLFPFC